MARGVALLLAFGVSSACAGTSGPPLDVAAKIRAGGRVVDGPAMMTLYRPLQTSRSCEGLRIERDVAYGPAPQNLADIFRPARTGRSPRPVLIFVHGGGFTGGERRTGPDSLFYDNVGCWAARHGFVGVNITYRRAPQAQWPAGAEDVGRAVAWARDGIAHWGGDAGRLYLMGHSAGATHVASYVADKRFWGANAAPLRGAIIVSGSFVVTAAGDAPPEDRPFLARASQYFGNDASLAKDQAAMQGLVRSSLPLLIVNAEYDPLYFRREASGLAAAVEQSGRRHVRFVVLPGHNHMSQIFAIGTRDEGLTSEIQRFVKAGGK